MHKDANTNYSATLSVADITIDVAEVLRYLAYKRDRKDVPIWLLNIIEKQIAETLSLLEPWYIFTFINSGFLQGTPSDAGCAKMILGLCTVGQHLDDATEKLFQHKRYDEWVVLDAIGTVAVEQVMLRASEHIKVAARNIGLYIAEDVTPGTAHCPLDCQLALFSTFPPELLRVRLNDSGMMVPKKSLSFAFTLTDRAIAGHLIGDCSQCTYGLRCAYKKQPVQERS